MTSAVSLAINASAVSAEDVLRLAPSKMCFFITDYIVCEESAKNINTRIIMHIPFIIRNTAERPRKDVVSARSKVVIWKAQKQRVPRAREAMLRLLIWKLFHFRWSTGMMYSRTVRPTRRIAMPGR